nr:hypothetical protein [Candidatus Sigynarchaeota archaeon]
AIDGHVVMLRLEKCNIKEIPPCISRFVEMQYLNVNDNSISEIPDFLANLFALKVLALINNRIAALPESIWNVQNLEELIIAGNPVTEISRINPIIDVPPGRLRTLKNLMEGNLLDFLRQLKVLQNDLMNHSNDPINLELVAIIGQFLSRIKQEFPEDVVHTFVSRSLSGQ